MSPLDKDVPTDEDGRTLESKNRTGLYPACGGVTALTLLRRENAAHLLTLPCRPSASEAATVPQDYVVLAIRSQGQANRAGGVI